MVSQSLVTVLQGCSRHEEEVICVVKLINNETHRLRDITSLLSGLRN